MNKNRTLTGIILCLFAVSVFSGCGGGGSTPAAVPEKPISFDVNTYTAKGMDYYTQNDTYDMLAAAGPYYMPDQELDQPVFTEYDKLRAAKIEEAKKLTMELVDAAKEAESKLKEAPKEAPNPNLQSPMKHQAPNHQKQNLIQTPKPKPQNPKNPQAPNPKEARAQT